jgi:phage-related protein
MKSIDFQGDINDRAMTDKPLEWIGRSKEDLMDFPDDARRKAGFELRSIQQGDVASDVKPMSTIGNGRTNHDLIKLKCF